VEALISKTPPVAVTETGLGIKAVCARSVGVFVAQENWIRRVIKRLIFKKEFDFIIPIFFKVQLPKLKKGKEKCAVFYGLLTDKIWFSGKCCNSV
jgi:hypothetical protein